MGQADCTRCKKNNQRALSNTKAAKSIEEVFGLVVLLRGSLITQGKEGYKFEGVASTQRCCLVVSV